MWHNLSLPLVNQNRNIKDGVDFLKYFRKLDVNYISYRSGSNKIQKST